MYIGILEELCSDACRRHVSGGDVRYAGGEADDAPDEGRTIEAVEDKGKGFLRIVKVAPRGDIIGPTAGVRISIVRFAFEKMDGFVIRLDEANGVGGVVAELAKVRALGNIGKIGLRIVRAEDVEPVAVRVIGEGKICAGTADYVGGVIAEDARRG